MSESWGQCLGRATLGFRSCPFLPPACSGAGRDTGHETMRRQSPYAFALAQETRSPVQLGSGCRGVEFKGKYLSAGAKKGKDGKPGP